MFKKYCVKNISVKNAKNRVKKLSKKKFKKSVLD